MSDFHGGFFVRSLDAAVAEPIRQAVADALRTRGIDLERNALTFAARRGCPVMHVAIRGAVADGKDYAFFHLKHAAIGGDIARVIGCDVWAYHYENQSGSESVHSFGPDGRARESSSVSWDDLAPDDDDDGDEDDRHDRMLAAAPLGILAATLGVPRAWLDMDLAYDTPVVRVPLASGPCTDAVRAYLDAPLRTARQAPTHSSMTAELDVAQSLYFPSWMAEELEAIANKLGAQPGTIVWAAWEAAKPDLYRAVPIVETFSGADAIVSPPRFLVPPPVVPPAGVAVPRLVPVFMKALPPPPDEDDKVKLTLALPSRVLDELRELATAGDRSLSWCAQKAFVLVRGRLHAAESA